MKTKLYYLQIAEKVFPGLQHKRFFTAIGGTEHYYSGLRMTEVEHIYKSYYDEFDFAFSIRCTFSICDKQEGRRWIRQPGDEHLFSTPPAYVVQRSDVSCSPAQIIEKMKKFYKANVLICSGRSHPMVSEAVLREIMETNKLCLIHKTELPDDFQISSPDRLTGRKETDRQKILKLTAGIKVKSSRVSAY